MNDAQTFAAYVLRSLKTGRSYVGSTQNIEERLRCHNSGYSKSTKAGIPWILVYSETFASRAEATNKERYWKTGKGRDELARILSSITLPKV